MRFEYVLDKNLGLNHIIVTTKERINDTEYYEEVRNTSKYIKRMYVDKGLYQEVCVIQ